MDSLLDNAWTDLMMEMKRIDPSKDYYAFTFTANEDGKIEFTCHTHWGGWADKEHKTEIREPSLVIPEKMAKVWDMLEQPYLVVNEAIHYVVYQFLGGHALIAHDIAHEWADDLLQLDVAIRSGRLGFVSVDSLPKHVFNRVPNPKQRMSIIKRDNSKCAICGRRPVDYLDLELHVHHIRPWAKGGLTEDTNLITLCNTCHNGLEPHDDQSLFSLIPRNNLSAELENSEYLKSVQLYRKFFWQAWNSIKAPRNKKRGG